MEDKTKQKDASRGAVHSPQGGHSLVDTAAMIEELNRLRALHRDSDESEGAKPLTLADAISTFGLDEFLNTSDATAINELADFKWRKTCMQHLDPGSEREYVAAWAMRYKGQIKVTKDKAVKLKGSDKNYLHLINKSYLDHRSFCRDRGIKPNVSSKDMEKAWSEFVDALEVKQREELATFLKHDTQYKDEPDRLYRFIAKDESCELSVARFKHVLWQAKRKMMGIAQDTDFRMAMCLKGRQNSGKSYLLRQFVLPLMADHWADYSLQAITDERKALALANSYMSFCDELSMGINNERIQQLKDIITNSWLSVQVMRSNVRPTIKNNSTLFFSIDRQLTDIIKDNAGMRRFFQIDVKDVIPRTLNQEFNFEQVWLGIDETLPNGYVCGDLLDAHLKASEGLKYITLYDEFADAIDLLAPSSNKVEINFDTFYSYFKTFAERNGEKVPAARTFTRELNARGIEKVRRRIQVDGQFQTVGYVVEISSQSFEALKMLNAGI